MIVARRLGHQDGPEKQSRYNQEHRQRVHDLLRRLYFERAFFRADQHTFVAVDTFDTGNSDCLFHIDVDRADLAAGLAVDAQAVVALNDGRADLADNAIKYAHRAEIFAEEPVVEYRTQQSHCQQRKPDYGQRVFSDRC